jgi:hypothetical protein
MQLQGADTLVVQGRVPHDDGWLDRIQSARGILVMNCQPLQTLLTCIAISTRVETNGKAGR